MKVKKNYLQHSYSIRTGLLRIFGFSLLWTGAALATGNTGTTAEWTSHGGNLEGTHYSELSDINLNTIGTLAQPKLIQEFALKRVSMAVIWGRHWSLALLFMLSPPFQTYSPPMILVRAKLNGRIHRQSIDMLLGLIVVIRLIEGLLTLMV